MSRDHIVRALALIASIGLLSASGLAAETAETPDENLARARSVVRRAAQTLERAQTLRVQVELEYDVLQESGVQLEFGGTRSLVMRRPDRLRIEGTRRDGARSELYFDGKTGTLYFPDQGVYSRADMGPTVDTALETLEDELGVPVPNADLLRSDVVRFLDERTEDGFWVGIETLDGVSCDHVAFETETVDAQLWVSREEPPLIRRMVLAYVNEEGDPQFRASFRDWELDTKVSDAAFVFTPTEGAEQVPFVAIGRAPSGDSRGR